MSLSRRGLLLGAGAAAAAAASVVVPRDPAQAGTVVPFRGRHQAGITTPVQGHLHFASFDLTTPDRAAVVRLLQRWTGAAEVLTRGLPLPDDGDPLAPPADTGEAVGLDAARLTLTVGFGPSLYDRLALPRPPELADLPAFAGDALDPARSGGDLCVQACADDPQVAVHAVRTLTRLATGTAAVRWAQLGFGKASRTESGAQTPRNLFGFKDGTSNPTRPEQVWTDDGWTFLVARRIAMRVETWDRTSLREQEQVTGRTKAAGAPLGGAREHDPVVPAALPPTSHVALAHPSAHGGATMLRRGYSYVDGSDGLGHLDAGLFFLAYQRDPRASFVSVQRALSRSDAMSEYLRHLGSSLWAVPPGVGPGGWLGETLLDRR